MLELKKITKIYKLNNFKQTALNKVNLKFRDSEFVSILGQSGSGKTTMLNIIGGLDGYSSGDLIINGVSTKNYKDLNWDVYRNHKVGFVFQSYNLINHQTILSNVELALTISGVGNKERRKRALDMLKKVGLKDHVNKKPNQLSGGQMQRVAIARALINDPDILLADEPTGALDSETSDQIMDLLKEIAKDKLVIMVTHNPELAAKYSTRIVNLLDGEVTSDSNPFDGKKQKEVKDKKTKKNFMSFKTALSLSFNNLLTKKGRTLMTAFAGSIGIIGIALILSLSNGLQEYIDRVEEDTLSSYPILLEEKTVDATSFMKEMSGNVENKEIKKDKDTVYSNDMMVDMMSLMTAQMISNNLGEFKSFIEKDDKIDKYLSAVQYSYDLDLQLYKNTLDEVVQVNPNPLFDDMQMQSPMMANNNIFIEMLDNQKLLKKQYNLLAGSWTNSYNEVMLLVDENNQISDFALYTLGLKDQNELKEMMDKMMLGEEVKANEQTSYTYEELLNLSYRLVLNTDYYEKQNNIWVNQKDNDDYMKNIIKDAPVIKVVGIIKQNEDSNIGGTKTGGILYNKELTKYVIDEINKTDIAQAQLANEKINILTGLEFIEHGDSFDMNKLTLEEKKYLSTLSQEELSKIMASYAQNEGVTYDDILSILGIVKLEEPSSIKLYPKDFEAKENLENYINDYNDIQKENKKDENVISYTDYIGLLLSSVTVIIDMISYILIAFVSISLVVSSIMIGIITYISVLERTKEIGILRAIGASKKDISRVFNAETFIIGLASGILGIGITLIINVFASMIIKNLTGAANIASLPLVGGIILVAISVILTLISGLIPSKVASKKNPVEALRTE